jgi:hypothetical protein
MNGYINRCAINMKASFPALLCRCHRVHVGEKQPPTRSNDASTLESKCLQILDVAQQEGSNDQGVPGIFAWQRRTVAMFELGCGKDLFASVLQHSPGAIDPHERGWVKGFQVRKPAAGPASDIQYIAAANGRQKRRSSALLEQKQGIALCIVDLRPTIENAGVGLSRRNGPFGARRHRLSRFGLRRAMN